MKAFIILVISLLFFQVDAQVSKDSSLFMTMINQSSQLYERGFNQCEISYLESVAHTSLLAYYEQGEAQNRAKFFEDVQKHNCADRAKQIIRKIDSSSLEVFSLDNKGVTYGAVQSGSINFYLHEPGKADIKTGTAKFTQVWLLENGKWLLKEIMSFGHQDAK